MPTAIAAAISVSTAVGTFITAGALVGTAAAIVGAIVIIGTVALATAAMKRKQKQSQASGISGTLVTKAGSSVGIPVVYGQRRMGGHRTFIGSNGAKNADLHIVESLCEGPVEACTAIYFNDELVASCSTSGSTTNGDWTWENTEAGASWDTYLDVEFYDGSQTAASAALVAQGLSGWDANCIGTNTAYVYFKMTFNQEAFASGLPQITYLIKGKRVPAIGAAWNSTLTWTDEPARIVYDFLVNPTYGKGISETLIDSSSFNSSSSYNQTSVPRTSTDPTGVPRYTTNAYLDTETSLLENIGELLVPMRAGIITGDKYQIIQDRPTAPVGVSIDDDSIVGTITYLQANKRTLMNAVRSKFPNAETPFNYQEDIAIVESSLLQSSTYDGVKLQKDIDLNNVTDSGQATRIATEESNQSRQSGVLEVTVDPSNLDLTVGDVVSFSNSVIGQSGKLYRIIKTVLRSDHTLELNMREYDQNVYWDNNQTILVDNKDDTDH